MKAAAVLLCLMGCAGMSSQEQTYWACSAFDAGTTIWGLEEGFEESNPLVQSGSTVEAAVSMALISGAVGWGLHKLEKKTGNQWGWVAVGGPHCLAAVANTYTISEDS